MKFDNPLQIPEELAKRLSEPITQVQVKLLEEILKELKTLNDNMKILIDATNR